MRFEMTFVALLVCGCAVTARHSQIGPDQFIIEAVGGSNHTHGEVLHAAHREAGKICRRGYSLVDSQNSARAGMLRDTSRVEVVLVVKCHPTAGPAPAAQPPRSGPGAGGPPGAN